MAEGCLLSSEFPDALNGRSLLIFDFDGTVADTTPLHAQAFADVLGDLGVLVRYSDIAGLRTDDAIRVCLTKAGRDFSDGQVMDLTRRKQMRVRDLIVTGLRPLPGVDSFLRAAMGRRRVALATSGSRGTVMMALKTLGYEGWFVPTVCADDVACAKPAPDLFLSALARTGVPCHQAIVFEDAPSGFEAARAACIDHVDVRGLDWALWKGAL